MANDIHKIHTTAISVCKRNIHLGFLVNYVGGEGGENRGSLGVRTNDTTSRVLTVICQL